MPVFSGRSILGLWSSLLGILLAAALLGAAARGGGTLTSTARAYRESPSQARKQALLKLAASDQKGLDGALALLVAGVTEVERGNAAEGLRHLEACRTRLPLLADFVHYSLGVARLRLKEYHRALGDLSEVMKKQPLSPLIGEGALLAAEAYTGEGLPREAVKILQENSQWLPQPQGDLSLARAYEQAGELILAAEAAQRVYYHHPTSPQAKEAEQLLGRLAGQLGASYPAVPASTMLARADRLLQAREYARARQEYRALTSQLGGVQAELARVRVGASTLLEGNPRAAAQYLESLSLRFPEADAERWFYLVRGYRALGDEASMVSALETLNRQYRSSQWRLEALIWAGNHFLLRNSPDRYLPLFRACFEEFPERPQAATCHWRVAWARYLEQREKAAGLLEEHLNRFPRSDKVPAALYFLGRIAERTGNQARAHELFARLHREYPNSYYTLLAESKAPKALRPGQQARLSFEATGTAKLRIERAKLLGRAALDNWASRELRFGARTDTPAHVAALELARLAAQRQAHAEAIRHIKGVFSEYLSVPLEEAPLEFWRLAFPLPYRTVLQRYAKAHNLDLYLLAGLIRQESEFDARAVSSAGARGLMQILPATGSQLSRRLGLRSFRPSMLAVPDINVRLGTYYLERLLAEHQGNLEAALASYNAGKSRVDFWLAWWDYKEPAEFVETIPLTETRGYVQSVLRNAWLYRRIYHTLEAEKSRGACEAPGNRQLAELGPCPGARAAAFGSARPRRRTGGPTSLPDLQGSPPTG